MKFLGRRRQAGGDAHAVVPEVICARPPRPFPTMITIMAPKWTVEMDDGAVVTVVAETLEETPEWLFFRDYRAEWRYSSDLGIWEAKNTLSSQSWDKTLVTQVRNSIHIRSINRGDETAKQIPVY